jgi:hypothetical protein
MIPPMSSSVIFNHPADFCAAILAPASEDETLPLHLRLHQDNWNRPNAPSAKHVVENLFLCPWGDGLPSPRCLQRERITWTICDYHFVFSM